MDWKNLYLSTEGRINRKAYFLGILPMAVIGLVALIIDGAVGSYIGRSGIGVCQIISWGLLLWPSIALAVKRLHDRNRSGWFVLLGYIPFVNFWIGIEVLFLKGTPGDNRYGANPLTTEVVTTEQPA